ncbi:MAG: hypothetical protein ACK58L_19960 [Planctomycetota bacterium]
MVPWTSADLQALLEERDGPCVSLFLPVHRQDPQQDRLRFRIMVSEAEERLQARGMSPETARDFLMPLHDLQNDSLFWRNPSDGVAVFLAPGFFEAYRLPWSFTEELDVGRVFLVIPLLPMLAADGHYYLLALSQKHVRLFHGTHFRISQMDLNGVPRSLAEAMRTTDSDMQFRFHTQPAPNGTPGAMDGESAVGTDNEKNDLLRYFQRIDHGLRTIFREDKAPLVLASVEDLQPIFREASSYPHLTARGIIANPDRLSGEELHQQVWEVVCPLFENREKQALIDYDEAQQSGNVTVDSIHVIQAAIHGEVSTLFASLDHRVRGTVDFQSKRVTIHEQAKPGDEDLSNLAAVCTLRRGHVVHALRRTEMPEKSSLAAIWFRSVKMQVVRPPSG